MNTEEDVTRAFQDLKQRTSTVDVDAGPHRQTSPPRNPLIPALVLAAVVVVAAFSAWQLWPSNGSDTDSVNVATDGTATDDDDGGTSQSNIDDDATDGATQTQTDPSTQTDDLAAGIDTETGDRYRVDTDQVAADSADPFLNVRAGAGAGETLLAKLPPTYRGLAATGNEAVADNGADWVEVELMDPVHYTGPETEFNANPTGWVNASLVLALTDGVAVGTDEVPACAGDGAGGSAGGLGSDAYVYALESRYLSDDCLRVVLTMASGTVPYFWDDIDEGTGPADALPRIFERESGGSGVIVDLGSTEWAWPRATDTADDVYLVRDHDRLLDLVLTVPVGPITTTPLPELGVVVIDVGVSGPAPLSDGLVALTKSPMVSSGMIAVAGISRPFEANIGVSVVDSSGQPVTAIFSGSDYLGTVETDEYGVSTTDWTDAWGRFSVQVEGLPAGTYNLLLTTDESDAPVPAKIPFTISEGPADPPTLADADQQRIAMAFNVFARGFTSAAELPLADEVTLSLGVSEQQTVAAGDLADRDNWTFDVDNFNGWSGPFNVLDVIDGRPFRITAGDIPHCAGPPLNWPADWQALSQVNMEPVAIDSCLQWFGASLFLNADDEIEAVALDLWEP
jgi:hypothetical protein